ncbi:MAG TPA: hypothetical protein VHE32_02865 [Rhodanobacteraceae bacterium]|nr:hypothetical protein [Rhodanobacteraceae bacterium]
MRGSTRALVLTAALAACAMTSAHADDHSTLEERMSYKDFTRLGLDKLSPEQLRGLNEWVRTNASGAFCTPAAAAAPNGTTATAATADRIVSRIAGDFVGWEKGTVLKLANGEAWEVRDDEPLIASRENAPAVTIEKGLIGGWRLSVEGHEEIAHVIPAGK